MRVWLGNTAAKEGYRPPGEDQTLYRDISGNRVTYVVIPDEYSLAEAFKVMTDPEGVWVNHSNQPPAWVASDSPGLEQLLAENFHCEAGMPEDVEETHYTTSGAPTLEVGAVVVPEPAENLTVEPERLSASQVPVTEGNGIA